MSFYLLILLILTFEFTQPPVTAPPDVEARAIVERAIQAHGFNVKPVTGYSCKTTVVFFNGDSRTVHKGSVTEYGPDKARYEYYLNGGKKEVVVINGDKGWLKSDRTAEPMDEKELAETKKSMYVGWVGNLTPLKHKGFQLTALGEAKVGDQTGIGVKVSSTGRPDVDLFFDKGTGLLIQRTFQYKTPNGETVKYSSVYSGFKKIDGLWKSTRFAVYHDGKKRYEGETSEYRFFDTLDEDIFAKP